MCSPASKKKQIMNRRKFVLSGTGAIAFSVFGGLTWILNACKKVVAGPKVMRNVLEGTFDHSLPVPAVLDGNLPITLESKEAVAQLLDTKYSKVIGYNGSILGPTIKLNSGSVFQASFINSLPDETNIHWHGLMIPQAMDGHPENIIGAGSSFEFNFTVNQRAGTYWYHPHPHGNTAYQVFKGLAGFFIVNDDEENALNLPTGERELLMVLQDKRIYADGGLDYSPNESEIMTGYSGEYVLVNGKWAPCPEVSTTWYRLRILNGSTARIYNLALSNDMPFILIGNDGGLLSNAQSVDTILLAPGERADVLVDFSANVAGDEIYLKNLVFNDAGLVQGMQSFRILKFTINQNLADSFVAPSYLSLITPIPESLSTYNRNFDIQQMDMEGHSGMDMGSMQHTINGKSYDMDRIDASVVAGSTEIWTFDNSNSTEIHPMHVHGVQFQILDRTGGRGQLFPHEQGWKDMALVMAHEKVRVIITFPNNPGKFVLHCHNLEHEDSGMMLNFQIQ